VPRVGNELPGSGGVGQRLALDFDDVRHSADLDSDVSATLGLGAGFDENSWDITEQTNGLTLQGPAYFHCLNLFTVTMKIPSGVKVRQLCPGLRRAPDFARRWPP
jgi:hypothetical protein